MEEFLKYALSALGLILFTVASVLLKALSDYFAEKANSKFDDARSEKIKNVTEMITDNVVKVVATYLSENNIRNINASTLNKVVADIRDRITAMTGGGVIDFVLKTIADNWDDWLHELILYQLGNQAYIVNDRTSDTPTSWEREDIEAAIKKATEVKPEFVETGKQIVHADELWTPPADARAITPDKLVESK